MVPPLHPIDAEEVLKRLGRLPSSTAKNRKAAIRRTMLNVRREYGLTVWKDLSSREYLYDAEEVERLKRDRWVRVPTKKQP